MPGTVRSKQKLVKFGYSFGVYFKAWILFKSKIQQLIRYENTIFARKYIQANPKVQICKGSINIML